jgi:hypothetical protein
MLKKVIPSLESITIRAKYIVQETDFNCIIEKIRETLVYPKPPTWILVESIGKSVGFMKMGRQFQIEMWKTYKETQKDPQFLAKKIESMLLGEEDKEFTDMYCNNLYELRPGYPYTFNLTTVEQSDLGILVEVECRPTMWYLIVQGHLDEFTQNQVEEALLEGRKFVRQVMSIFKAREVEPISVYPIIQRTEIKSRLLNLGLKEIVDHLDDAERHIVQNNFPESLTSSRTAFEKMIDWQMKKRGLEKTDNQKNNLERLKSRGHLDPDITQLLQSYYHCLSTIGVHEKGVPPSFYEAQMGYGMTLIMLDYFANKLP